MLFRCFGLSWQYVEDELPWHMYYVLLSVALDLEERDQHFRYVLAGGDPKKWRWSSSDKAGTSDQGQMWDKVLSKTRHVKAGDIAHIAQDHWERIRKVTETYADGSTKVRYVNEHGEDITEKVRGMQGHYFMKTRKGADS